MFRGHMRGLAREKETAQDSLGALRRLMGYFKPFAALLVIVALLLVLNTLLRVAGPYLTELMVNEFIAPGQSEGLPSWLAWIAPAGIEHAEGAELIRLRIAGVVRMAVLLLAVYVLGWLCMAGQSLLMSIMGQKVLFKMRTEILERIHTLSLKFFDEREAGDLMSRLVNDTQVINQMFTQGIVRLLSMSLSIVAIVVTMFTLQWDYALVSFSLLPVMILATTLFARRARKAFRKTRETIGDVSAELQENIAGVREVQAFARERTNVAEFRQVNRANRDANVQAQTLTSAFSPTLDVLGTVAQAIVFGYGGWLVVRQGMGIGRIVSFTRYVQDFYRPIQMISGLWTQFQSALAGAERIFELLDTEPEVTDAADAIALPPAEGRIAFEGVNFHYKPEEPVLHDITLEAEPGQTVALVGPTGAGKTSIVSLLMRFYDVIDGRIAIDGHDIRQVTQASLRQQMGIVLQDTFLFSGSVMDNIRYGRLDATDEEVIAAARLANADDFIARLPDGYETDIGERGHNLSQGQRQLLSIARAILANPRILILDEATSSVDTRTEVLIQRALDELLRGRTSFVIAHRLSTIRNADKVLVLDGGRIVERGTHASLMAAQGRYYELYMSQFRRDQDEDEGEKVAVPADGPAGPPSGGRDDGRGPA